MSAGREHIERISEALENLESDLDERGEEIGERVRGAELVIRILAAVMGLLALINLYFVNDLTEEVKGMILSMNQMISHFDNVSKRMDSVVTTVTDMNDQVRMMPIVASQMEEISGLVQNMQTDVDRITGVTGNVGQKINILNQDMYDMALRYRRVNQGMGLMQQDMKQMAKPVP